MAGKMRERERRDGYRKGKRGDMEERKEGIREREREREDGRACGGGGKMQI